MVYKSGFLPTRNVEEPKIVKIGQAGAVPVDAEDRSIVRAPSEISCAVKFVSRQQQRSIWLPTVRSAGKGVQIGEARSVGVHPKNCPGTAIRPIFRGGAEEGVAGNNQIRAGFGAVGINEVMQIGEGLGGTSRQQKYRCQEKGSEDRAAFKGQVRSCHGRSA